MKFLFFPPYENRPGVCVVSEQQLQGRGEFARFRGRIEQIMSQVGISSAQAKFNALPINSGVYRLAWCHITLNPVVGEKSDIDSMYVSARDAVITAFMQLSHRDHVSVDLIENTASLNDIDERSIQQQGY